MKKDASYIFLQDEVMRRAQTLPQGTFGRAYGDFMAQRGFHADDRPPVRFVNSKELAYVAMRSRETHDLWHVLFNCQTTVLGELALKAVEFVQVHSDPQWTCASAVHVPSQNAPQALNPVSAPKVLQPNRAVNC